MNLSVQIYFFYVQCQIEFLNICTEDYFPSERFLLTRNLEHHELNSEYIKIIAFKMFKEKKISL